MDNRYKQMSMVEVAYELLKSKKEKQNIRELINAVLKAKGLVDEDGEKATQLYMDITTSSKFVYMGNEEWDLKENQSLAEWDKDGASFNSKEDLVEVIEEEEDDLFEDIEDEEDLLEDEDEEEEEEEEEEEVLDDSEEEEEEIETAPFDDLERDDSGKILERFTEDEDFDEEKYNDLMDDFEDMYD